jgi:4-hydroxy-tetrahydrodipicolinate synthase
LTLEERSRLAELVVEAAGKRVPVIVHAGAATTADSVALAQHAYHVGADAAAVVTPYYFRLSEEALLRHFEQVAVQVPVLPMYLYNIPQCTGNAISAGLVARLVERCPNIVGMKDSSGSLTTLVTSLTLHDGRFNAAIGNDSLILAGIAVGIGACVSGNANVVPELLVALYNAASLGDLALARRLQRQVDALSHILGDGGDLSLFKAILARRGVAIRKVVRAPLLEASQAQVEQCWHELSALGLEVLSA